MAAMRHITGTIPLVIDGTDYAVAFTFRTLRELERKGIGLGSQELEAAGVEGQINMVKIILDCEHKDARLTEDDILDGINLFALNEFGQKVRKLFNPEDGEDSTGVPTE